MAPRTIVHSIDHSKEVVYDYIRELACDYAPDQAVVAFYDLLCQRLAVGRQEVVGHLDQVLAAESFRQEPGLHFLNRSFYTICNRWHLDNTRMPYLDQLVSRLHDLPTPTAKDPLTRLLQRRLQDFSQGDYGDCLHRQMRLGPYGKSTIQRQRYQGLVGDYLSDYFYLYRSTTRTPDIEELELKTYENPLDSGLGYKQSKKLEDMYRAMGQYRRAMLQGETELVNPTRLPLAAFEQGLVDYHPDRQDGFTQRAVKLETLIHPTQSYEVCRPAVQDYLITSLEALPNRTREKLHRELFRVLGAMDNQAPMARSTAIGLFSRLLNAIFLPEYNTSNILRFQKYLDSSGPVLITNVLLSLVVAYPMIRFDLERKLGYLYRCFEKTSLAVGQWLVDFFEYINLALVMNAKHIGYFSVVTQLPNLDSI